MTLININNSKDPNFRYKINIIEINHTGSGNGCFTNLLNLDKISSQINHNKLTLLKYLGINLGCKINQDKFWLQGHHYSDKIQEIIFEFINSFVLCPKCSIPELKYNHKKFKKLELINITCLGCGFNTDINHKCLKKNNIKIYDKILQDIKDNFFSNKTITKTLEFNFQLTNDNFY